MQPSNPPARHGDRCRCGACKVAVKYGPKRMAQAPKTVFDAISQYGHDEDYRPVLGVSTDLAPGSPEKIELMRARVDRGEAVFHPFDRVTYDGHSPGCVDPRQVGDTQREYGIRVEVPRSLPRKADY